MALSRDDIEVTGRQNRSLRAKDPLGYRPGLLPLLATELNAYVRNSSLNKSDNVIAANGKRGG